MPPHMMSQEAGWPVCSLSAPTSRDYVIHQLKPQTKAKVQLPKCSLKRITFIVYTNASSQMPKSLPKPKKNCYQSSTLGRKKMSHFWHQHRPKGKKFLFVLERRTRKRLGWGCGSVIETQPYIPEALGFQPSAPETQNQSSTGSLENPNTNPFTSAAWAMENCCSAKPAYFRVEDQSGLQSWYQASQGCYSEILSHQLQNKPCFSQTKGQV